MANKPDLLSQFYVEAAPSTSYKYLLVDSNGEAHPPQTSEEVAAVRWAIQNDDPSRGERHVFPPIETEMRRIDAILSQQMRKAEKNKDIVARGEKEKKLYLETEAALYSYYRSNIYYQYGRMISFVPVSVVVYTKFEWAVKVARILIRDGVLPEFAGQAKSLERLYEVVQRENAGRWTKVTKRKVNRGVSRFTVFRSGKDPVAVKKNIIEYLKPSTVFSIPIIDTIHQIPIADVAPLNTLIGLMQHPDTIEYLASRWNTSDPMRKSLNPKTFFSRVLAERRSADAPTATQKERERAVMFTLGRLPY